MSKAKVITQNILEDNYTQKTLFRFLIVGLVILFGVYLYFIGSITFNILARKTLENDVEMTLSRVSQLELEYLDKTGQIDKNYATSLGFVDAGQNIFASRQTDVVALR